MDTKTKTTVERLVKASEAALPAVRLLATTAYYKAVARALVKAIRATRKVVANG